MPKVQLCGNCGRPAVTRWKVRQTGGGTRLEYNCARCQVLGGYDPEPIGSGQSRGLLDRAGSIEPAQPTTWA
jgi:hypothetical protein